MGSHLTLTVCLGLLMVLQLEVLGLSTVLYGPSSREMLLLTAKVAAKEGIDTSLICAPGSEDGCFNLMYGTKATSDEEGSSLLPENHAKPISSGEDIQSSLEATDSLVFVALDTPIDEKSYQTLLNSAGDSLSKVVLLSKMGVSKASSGGFFSGQNGKLKASEDCLKELCESRGLGLSIVRAGNLKGGGPGEKGNDFGLDTAYYNSLFDVVEASVTMAHDKFTLGLACSKGDTIELPNAFTQMGTKSSFEACDYESNRILVASGVVASILEEGPMEFSVSAAKSQSPPTMEEWKTALAAL